LFRRNAVLGGGTLCRLFLIIEGSVKIFRTSPAGRELMLAIETAPSSVAALPPF
jgi:CRP/FNR family transcriptional regulator